MRGFHRETRGTFKTIGEHLVRIEEKLDALSKIDRLERNLERVRENIREKLHVDV